MICLHFRGPGDVVAHLARIEEGLGSNPYDVRWDCEGGARNYPYDGKYWSARATTAPLGGQSSWVRIFIPSECFNEVTALVEMPAFRDMTALEFICAYFSVSYKECVNTISGASYGLETHQTRGERGPESSSRTREEDREIS